ncbi:hypothetical protein [Bacillus cihuensis]|uniref:hypothetical protein n=1 Tax=Bacillus cihuensis TaxID=1208599 RepID=UPI0003FD2CA7|nr:hypothetical protein [Bacillus cihuensis]
MKVEKELLPSEKLEVFITSSEYNLLKQNTSFLKQAKKHLREQFSHYEGKRHEFKDINMLAKFVPVKVYETDHKGLIQELLCYVRPDVIFPLIQLSGIKEEDKDLPFNSLKYTFPKTYYVKPFFNKIGKIYNQTTDYLFGGQTTEQLLEEIKDSSSTLKSLEEKYDNLKNYAITCSAFNEKNKILTSFGSLSKIENKTLWDIEKLYNEGFEDTILQYGKISVSKLDDLILSGAVPNKVIQDYRKVVDIRLDFMVMQLDTEERILGIQQRKKIQSSLKRHA